jgi:hypothetical protein
MPAIALHLRPGVRRRTVQTSVRTCYVLDCQSGCSFSALPLITLLEDHGNRGDRGDPTVYLTERHCSCSSVCRGGTRKVPLLHYYAPTHCSIHHIGIWLIFHLQETRVRTCHGDTSSPPNPGHLLGSTACKRRAPKASAVSLKSLHELPPN